jgi:hypothetical protein
METGMAGRVFQVVHPRADWLKRVAVRLLDRDAQMKPLEAVRRAMEVFPDSQQDDPEQVADSLLVQVRAEERSSRAERKRSA